MSDAYTHAQAMTGIAGYVRSPGWSAERPTGELRVRLGIPGELTPRDFGLEMKWEIKSEAGVRHVWRPIPVVEHDAD